MYFMRAAAVELDLEQLVSLPRFSLAEAFGGASMVDKDRVEGSAKNLGGKVKEAAGKLTGDEKLKNEGRADQVSGKVQNVVGGLKDKIRENLDKDDDQRH